MKKISVAFIALLFLAVFCACTEQYDNSSPLESNKNDVSINEGSIIDFSEENESSESSADKNESETSSEISDEISWETSDESSDDEESSDANGDEYSKPEDDKEDEPDDKVEAPNYTYEVPEMLESGYLLYNDALYSGTSFSYEMAQRYAKVYATYAELFPNTRISVVNHPSSAINITDPQVRDMFNDQGVILDQMESQIYGNVNFVNLKNTFIEHRGEYLFFKSDWHWTQLAAYYAYIDFARSIGIGPTALDEFECVTVTTEFIGALAKETGDSRVNSFYDTVYAYLPRKVHTMTITNGNESNTYDKAIHTYIKNYSCFIVGDNGLVTINVPENDQTKTVMVIKDSTANPFVPFLIEHYGNIIVIDPRHIDIDIRSMVVENGVDDLIFFTKASTSNRSTYCDYYKRLIGM